MKMRPSWNGRKRHIMIYQPTVTVYHDMPKNSRTKNIFLKEDTVMFELLEEKIAEQQAGKEGTAVFAV